MHAEPVCNCVHVPLRESPTSTTREHEEQAQVRDTLAAVLKFVQDLSRRRILSECAISQRLDRGVPRAEGSSGTARSDGNARKCSSFGTQHAFVSARRRLDRVLRA